jgi:hypothetical protein
VRECPLWVISGHSHAEDERETKADADIAHVLTMDEARRIAANIAKLPTFLAAQSFHE